MLSNLDADAQLWEYTGQEYSMLTETLPSLRDHVLRNKPPSVQQHEKPENESGVWPYNTDDVVFL